MGQSKDHFMQERQRQDVIANQPKPTKKEKLERKEMLDHFDFFTNYYAKPEEGFEEEFAQAVKAIRKHLSGQQATKSQD